MKHLGLIILLTLLSSCMSTRVQFDDRWSSAQTPVYEDYFDYYLFGWLGQNSVNLQKVCMDQKVWAIKRYRSGEDLFLATITLGIYAPMTVRVWCGE